MRGLVLAAALLGACGDDSGEDADGGGPTSPFTMAVLSSRPDTVTGGDALVEVRAPVDTVGLSVRVGDRDVTSAFGPTEPGRWIGLVEGLPGGESVIEATAPGVVSAQLTVFNHPITGPVLSGPHQSPFLCRTAEAGLGAPLDGDCSTPVSYEYVYKNAAGEFVLLADPTQVPGDAQQVETLSGARIDYVVRIERGTINRAIYQISVLFDASAPPWTALTPAPQWTGKAVYSFKGGCGVGHHQGFLNATDDLTDGVVPLADAPVAAGFAILSASLNTLGVSCNDVVAAETAMMVKERFIERYGVPLYTMGWGGSGGAIQQHLIAENYPGILDGIVPLVSYPDVFSIYPDIMDCRLLVDYFVGRSAGQFPDAGARAAASGYANETTCQNWSSYFGHFEDPTSGCDPSIPPEWIYDPVGNPTGVRCTLADHNANLLGVDPGTGFARRFYDNRGVQYGLAALNAGAITKDQFLHLNEKIGGFGPDGVHQDARTTADPQALRALYQGGRVTHGDLGLAALPIVDLRLYTDDAGDIHDRVRSFALRARLMAANGDAGNHVMIMSSADGGAFLDASVAAAILMDAWLTALVADPNPDRAAATRATRPAMVTDLCYLTPGQDPLPGACETELPPHDTPRLIAGAPLTDDILACTLKPIDPGDYTVAFTLTELARLDAIFPDGVCDWTQPGLEQAPAAGTWQRF